jgi:hypothetical protein
MSLTEYFESTEGVGILGTADAEGKVDMAVYAGPQMIDDTTIGFIMRDRLSHSNVSSNPKACYLFIEKGEGYKGKRLYLIKTGEETDPEIIESHSRREQNAPSSDEKRFLVYFAIDNVRPLVGG